MTGETYPYVYPWLAFAVLVLMVAVFLLGRMVPRQAAIVQVTPAADRMGEVFKRFDDIEVHLKRFDEVEERLVHCEHDSKNIRAVVRELPTKDVVKELSERIGAVSGQVNAMASSQSANTRSLGRIEDFLTAAAADAIVNRRQFEAEKGSEK